MIDLLTVLRHAQLHNQNLHHLSKGPSSQQDHLLAGGFYEELAESYDTLAELMVGMGVAVDLPQVNRTAATDLPKITSNEIAFDYSSGLEDEIRTRVEELAEDAEAAVENFLQNLAQESRARSYKINQRLG